jgi:two-component system chemotaxis response regulator CheY
VRALRAVEHYRFTPILVLTTEHGEEIKQRGRAAGATGWLVKPFDPERLRQAVRKVLGRATS